MGDLAVVTDAQHEEETGVVDGFNAVAGVDRVDADELELLSGKKFSDFLDMDKPAENDNDDDANDVCSGLLCTFPVRLST